MVELRLGLFSAVIAGVLPDLAASFATTLAAVGTPFRTVPTCLSALATSAQVEMPRSVSVDHAHKIDQYKEFKGISEQAMNKEQFPSDPELLASMAQVAPILKDIWRLKDALEDSTTETNGKISPAEIQHLVSNVFAHKETTINDLLGSYSTQEDAARNWITLTLRNELQPLASLGPVFQRFITKPQGYAGDFLAIDWIYQNKPRSTEYLGRLIDEECLSLTACSAVRNRKPILTDVILETIRAGRGQGEPVEITSIACGPARELYDVFVENPRRTDLNCHLIDPDCEALGYVQDWMDDLGVSPDSISFYQKKLAHLALGKAILNTPKQDLMYSMGLIDYFQDKMVIHLLNFIYDMLKPGGKVMLGQFHKRNPTRGMMESVLEWKLFYRDEKDMDHIFMASKFGCPCSEILFDSTGVQMLACCTKPE